MFNPFFSQCLPLSVSFFNTKLENLGAWGDARNIATQSVWGRNGRHDERNEGLLFTSQERQVLCFWSVMLSTVWQIDFICRKYEIAYQLAITSRPRKSQGDTEKVPWVSGWIWIQILTLMLASYVPSGNLKSHPSMNTNHNDCILGSHPLIRPWG